VVPFWLTTMRTAAEHRIPPYLQLNAHHPSN
jgi:hypothetical protein